MAWVETIRIRNLATFKEALVPFRKGLNVVTGESGSGKTLIVRAFGMLLGEKDDPEVIREGAADLTVEALVALEDAPLEVGETLRTLGLQGEEFVSLGKAIQRSNKARTHVSGSAVARRVLVSLAREMIELVGQGEGGHFRDTRFQHQLLDDLLCVDSQRGAYQSRRARTIETLQSVDALLVRKRALEGQKDAHEALLAEIARIAPKPKEEAALAERRQFLKHAKEIQDALFLAKELLYDAKESVIAKLEHARRCLDPVFRFLPEAGDWSERLQKDALDVEDVALSISKRMKGEVRQEELDEVEFRLVELHTLKRRFGKEIEELLEEAQRFKGLEGDLEELALELKKAKERLEVEQTSLLDAARALTKARQEAVASFEKDLKAIASDLGLEALSLCVAFETAAAEQSGTLQESFPSQGLERLSLKVSFNRGDSLRPIERVASGGELSRVVLSLYALSLQRRNLPVLVLDEIDSGISGAGAVALGKLLRSLSSSCQVIVTTHNPLVASFADHHLVVRKKEAEGGTLSEVKPIEEKERQRELERMLVGSNISKHALLVAGDLLGGNTGAR
jgi:DNA repair protein RecN (Recombination protein N)